IYLSEHAWRDLEDNLRNQDKDEQRRAKEERKNGDGTAAQPSLLDLQSSRPGSNLLVPPMVPGGPYGDEQRSFYSEDARSFYSEDEYYQEDHYSGGYNDTESAYGSEVFAPSGSTFRELEMRKMLNGDSKGDGVEEEPEIPRKTTRGRKQWVALTWFLTWWIPGPFLRWCGGMKRPDVRMAWREKVALCFVILALSGVVIFFIAVFGKLICPYQNVFSWNELQAHDKKDYAYTAIRGEVFDLTNLVPGHWPNEVISTSALFAYAGKDSTVLFPIQVSALCDGTTGSVDDAVTLDTHVNLTDPNAAYHDFRYFTSDYRPDWYWNQMVKMRKLYRIGFMGYDPKDLQNQAKTNMASSGISNPSWAILNNDIYDLSAYLAGGLIPRVPTGQQVPANLNMNFMDSRIVDLFKTFPYQDITKSFEALNLDSILKERQLVCLRNLFFIGKTDNRNSTVCQFSTYLLLIISVMLCAVILFKFLAALQLGGRREPEEYDKFIICQVPCYTESEESLRKTIDSLSVLRYDDKRKLLFLIADGMLIGSGNDRPTPRIVLDILGVDPNVDPEPLSFESLGDGMAQHNMAKVYSGLYECSGHVVPYIVVVKVGKPTERQKPGNRGKRDSQMILMRFLNKVHFNSEMTPMELEIFHQIKNVIGVNPSFYEFVLMVDADTEIMPDSLNRMVSCFVHDAKIIGLCGETMISNEKDTWVTMIQVYEYYISHHLAKAFESLFGSVTCLPGCFCMYRIRSATKNQPLLISNQMIQDYSENIVETLHMKNLLHLGEDRYLTTLILKHFPNYKTKFTPDAACKTNAPDRWPVLLSQRRRWINSTVHNLLELMFLPQLCGFCCFSMRFVVILDLLGTLVMPAIVVYLGFLIYSIAVSPTAIPFWSVITLAGVYGLQALIFIIRRKWEHVGWMIVYLLAIPVFSFAIPLYSFWHFDDFSWGNTRVVVGEKGKKLHLASDEGKFDPKSIPRKKWTDYEQELWEVGSHESHDSRGTAHTGYTHESYRSHRSLAPAGAGPGSTAGSIYNDAASYYSGNGGNSGRSRSRSPAPMAAYDNQSIRQQSFTNVPIVSDPRMSRPYSDMMSQRGSVFMNRTPSEIDLAYANMPPGMGGGSRAGSMMPPGGSVMDAYYASGPGSSASGDGAILPTDEEILQEIRRILSTSDLMSITKKQVRDELSAFFGVDMSSRREFVNSCIEQVLQGKL
ncbi:chitin synthase-domain-containing protein, partial [Jimgerdemannia flammicorona]